MSGWAPGPVWTAAENLAPTRIRSPDRPARSESLYRLSYPGPQTDLQVRKSNSGATAWFVTFDRDFWGWQFIVSRWRCEIVRTTDMCVAARVISDFDYRWYKHLDIYNIARRSASVATFMYWRICWNYFPSTLSLRLSVWITQVFACDRKYTIAYRDLDMEEK
jgi:hypothetical protein